MIPLLFVLENSLFYLYLKNSFKADFHEANWCFDFHAEANFGVSFVADKLHHDSKRKRAAIN